MPGHLNANGGVENELRGRIDRLPGQLIEVQERSDRLKLELGKQRFWHFNHALVNGWLDLALKIRSEIDGGLGSRLVAGLVAGGAAGVVGIILSTSVVVAATSAGIVLVLAWLYLYVPSDRVLRSLQEREQTVLMTSQSLIDDLSRQRSEELQQQHSLEIERANSCESLQQYLAGTRYRRQKLMSEPWNEYFKQDFNDFLGRLFRELGYEVEPVGASEQADSSSVCDKVQGVDLVISRNDRRLAVHTLAGSETADSSCVQQALNDYYKHKCDGCVVITNGQFDAGARVLAGFGKCALVDAALLREVAEGKRDLNQTCPRHEQPVLTET